MKYKFLQTVVAELVAKYRINETTDEKLLQEKYNEIERYLYRVVLQEPEFKTEEINDLFLLSNTYVIKEDIKPEIFKKKNIQNEEEQKNYQYTDEELYKLAPPRIEEISSKDQVSREKLHRDAAKVVVKNIMEDLKLTNKNNKFKQTKKGENIKFERKTLNVLKACGISNEEFVNKTEPERVELLQNYINDAKKVIDEALKIADGQQLVEFMKKNINYINALNEFNNEDKFRLYQDFFGEDKNFEFVEKFFNEYGEISNSICTKLINDFAYICNPYSVKYNKEDMSLLINYCQKGLENENVLEKKGISQKQNPMTGLECPFQALDDLMCNNYLDKYNKITGITTKDDTNNLFIVDEAKRMFSSLKDVSKNPKNKIVKNIDRVYFYDLENNKEITNADDFANNIVNGKNVTMIRKGEVVEIGKPKGGEIAFEQKKVKPFIIYSNLSKDSSTLEIIINDFLSDMDRVNTAVIFPTKQFSDFAKELKKLGSMTIGSDEYKKTIDKAAKYAKEYLEVKEHTSKKFTGKTYERIKVAQKFVTLFDKSLAYDKAVKSTTINALKFQSNEDVVEYASNKAVDKMLDIQKFYKEYNNQNKILKEADLGENVKSDFTTIKERTFEHASNSVKEKKESIMRCIYSLEVGNRKVEKQVKEEFIKLCDEVNSRPETGFNEFEKRAQFNEEKLILESVTNKLATVGIDGDELYKEVLNERSKQNEVQKIDSSKGNVEIDLEEALGIK